MGSTAWGISLAIACVSHPIPAAGQSERDEAGHEVVVEGVSGVAPLVTGCSLEELSFSGELHFRSSGQARRPLLDATYTADNGWDEPKAGPILTSEHGTFQVAVPVWDHVYSTRKQGEYEHSAGRARVTISAPGCKSRTFEVGSKWKPRVIVVKCPDRQT